LFGRAEASGRLAQLLDDVRRGQGGVLVLRGEPGVGKTALLQLLIGQAAGFRVIRGAGVESETGLAFAGLHELCAPMLGRLDTLAPPQSQALSTAFGLIPGERPDRFLLALAALRLLAETPGSAENQPLLYVMDDAQWLDPASAQILGFVGRRLPPAAIGLVLATRTVGAAPDDLAGLPEYRVIGLDPEAARAVLATVTSGPLDERVRDRIVEETHGNPRALLELHQGVRSAQLAGGFALPDALDLPQRIEHQYRERLRALPEPAQQLVLLAAADTLGDAALFFRAAFGLGLDPDALALAGGIVDVGARVRFRHPLARSAVYRAASPDARHAAHQALAAVTDPRTDPDRRAWHRAHATSGPDEAAAVELIDAAGPALSRGGVAAAAAFWERAVALTPDPGRRAARALTAAGEKYAAGDLEAAQTLLVTAEVGPLDELGRAQAQRRRAQLAFAGHQGREAPALLIHAAARLQPLDADQAQETLLQALVAALYAGRLADRSPVTAPALSAPGSGPGPLLLRGLGERLTGGYAVATLKQALSLYLPRPPAPDWWCTAFTFVAMDLMDDEAWLELATAQVRLARESGTLSRLPFALSHLAGGLIQAGQLSPAAALISEARRLDAGGLPYAPLLLAAWRGDAATALPLTETLTQAASARGEGAALTAVDYARAVLANGLGDYRAAADAADQAAAVDELAVSPWALSELVEAAVRSDQPGRATSAAEQLSAIAAATGTDWACGTAARSRALVSSGAAAEGLYREAIERLGRTRMSTHLARARLGYGEWLRRENRRSDARIELRTAFEALTAMGLAGFAERARRELRATGEKVPRRNQSARAALTAQEEQIAQLARQGRTNPEIGAELFISARTVEWHLRKAFSKLKITSRRDLDVALTRRRTMVDDELPGPAALLD
jgi:DNA-binding CsgD family transcriptional regulator